jgi:ankyrin repeat protein
MLGSTLKRCFCLALLILAVLAAVQSAAAQELVQTRRAVAAASDFLKELVAAIERDDKLGVMNALSQGLPVDVMDSNGNTMLMHAAKGGHVKVTQYLLDSGADPNIMAMNGATSLMLAVAGGHTSSVAALLKANADPNLRGPGLPPTLTYAASTGNTEIMQMLISSGAQLKALDQKGFNALEFSFLNKRTASINFLRPIYRAKSTTFDLSPAKIARAIIEKNDDALIRALALGFDPNRVINGRSPLDIAKKAGYDKGVALLIHAGALEKKDAVAINRRS